VQDEHNHTIGENFWFASFAPYESPRYVVVAMVQVAGVHGSGGIVCAPIAHDIYEALVKKEQSINPRNVVLN
jgi:cell division protein FtsI/penicillin-binding protein 2